MNNNEPHYKQYIGKKYAVCCKTQEEWDRVNDVKSIITRHEGDGYDYCCLDDSGSYTDIQHAKRDSYTILSVAEFFGEEEDSEWTFGQRITYGISSEMEKQNTQRMMNILTYGTSITKQINKPNKIKKTMSNIVKFAKDITLSADEKELRKAGLKDEDGNWTNSALKIVEDLEAKELGYKGFADLYRNVPIEGRNLSPFEQIVLFNKHEKELLDTAKKYNKENK